MYIVHFFFSHKYSIIQPGLLQRLKESYQLTSAPVQHQPRVHQLQTLGKGSLGSQVSKAVVAKMHSGFRSSLTAGGSPTEFIVGKESQGSLRKVPRMEKVDH